MDLRIPPAGWGQDQLSEFLDTVRNNQFSTFERMQTQYSLLRDINNCFATIAKHQFKPKDPIIPPFLGRAHAAYLTACGTATAGQSVETFILLRGCIEAAGYALLIHLKPDLGDIWQQRSADKNAVRQAFTFTAMGTAIRSLDQKLADVFTTLYERSLDFGAHPNEMAIAATMSIDVQNDRTNILLKHLDDNPLTMRHCMKSVAEAGLFSLFTFQRIYPEKFELLGLKQRLQGLRRRL